MKRIFMLFLIMMIASLTACNDTNQGKDDPSKTPVNENELDYELLMHLDFIPHELGNTMTLVSEEVLYQKWAEIFKFETIPAIDFANEEVLFVTAY